MVPKLETAERRAQIAKASGDREGCLAALGEFGALAEGVPAAAASADFDISKRNPAFFSHAAEEDAREEYFESVDPEKLYASFDPFFAGDAGWKEFREKSSRS